MMHSKHLRQRSHSVSSPAQLLSRHSGLQVKVREGARHQVRLKNPASIASVTRRSLLCFCFESIRPRPAVPLQSLHHTSSAQVRSRHVVPLSPPPGVIQPWHRIESSPSSSSSSSSFTRRIRTRPSHDYKLVSLRNMVPML